MEDNLLYKNKPAKWAGRYRIPSTRLKGWNYKSGGFYFVTICTKNRFCYFGKIVNHEMVLNDVGEIVRQYWLEISKHFNNVILDEFVVMPNHVHVIIIITKTNNSPINVETHCPSVETHCNASLQQRQQTPHHNKFGPQRNNLTSIIRGFKSATTKIINQKYGYGYFAWQPRYYDHIIRHGRALNNIRNYIINNPTNWVDDKNFIN